MYPQKCKLVKSYVNISSFLRIFEIACHSQPSLNVAFNMFGLVSVIF